MSDTLRVLPMRAFAERDLAYVVARVHERVEIVRPPAFDVATLTELARDAHVFWGEPPDEAIVAAAGDLRLIQVPWTGVDRLDAGMLGRYDVPVCNSHSNAVAVAEYAVAMTMALAKRLALHDRSLRRGEWRRPGATERFRPPMLLRGGRALVLGYGAIGREVATMLDGLAMRVEAVNTRGADEPPAPLRRLTTLADAGPAIAEADVVVLALPLTRSTRGLVDADLLAAMRPSALLVNISRGEVVDEEALYRALRDRRIAGAAIDTWYRYPTRDRPQTLPSERFPFHELDNLLLSPHRAGFLAGELPHLDDAIDNLNRLAEGRELRNVVDLEAGF